MKYEVLLSECCQVMLERVGGTRLKPKFICFQCKQPALGMMVEHETTKNDH